MIFRSAVGLAIVAVIAAVMLWRIHDEEALLREHFREEWEAYRGRTWRLLPSIY